MAAMTGPLTATEAAVIPPGSTVRRDRTTRSYLMRRRKPLDDLQQHRMIERAEPLRPGRGDELGDKPGHRQRHVRVARGGDRDPHVLVVQVDAEPRLELPREHRLPLQLEDRKSVV